MRVNKIKSLPGISREGRGICTTFHSCKGEASSMIRGGPSRCWLKGRVVWCSSKTNIGLGLMPKAPRSWIRYRKADRAPSSRTVNRESTDTWEAGVPSAKSRGLRSFWWSPLNIVKMTTYRIANEAKAPSMKEPPSNKSTNHLGLSPISRVVNKPLSTRRLRSRTTRAIKTRSTTQVAADAATALTSPSSISIHRLDCLRNNPTWK